jgi:hypothetical protein
MPKKGERADEATRQRLAAGRQLRAAQQAEKRAAGHRQKAAAGGVSKDGQREAGDGLGPEVRDTGHSTEPPPSPKPAPEPVRELAPVREHVPTPDKPSGGSGKPPETPEAPGGAPDESSNSAGKKRGGRVLGFLKAIDKGMGG